MLDDRYYYIIIYYYDIFISFIRPTDTRVLDSTIFYELMVYSYLTTYEKLSKYVPEHD
jgi:hypothetical protein